MAELYIGIEIETVMKRGVAPSVGGYRRPTSFCDCWGAGSDSSINRNGMPKGFEVCAEITSEILSNSEETGRNHYRPPVKLALKKLEEHFEGKPMSEVMRFNESCGCHMHFSMPRKKGLIRNLVSPFHTKILFQLFKKRLAAAVKNNEIKQATFNKIIKQYYRSFSRNEESRESREISLNFTSGLGTVEWRSLNLTGVTTWKELQTVINSAVDSLNDLIDKNLSKIEKTLVTNGETVYYKGEVRNAKRLVVKRGGTTLSLEERPDKEIIMECEL